jgi:hypothetical protein
MSTEELCSNLPNEFNIFLNYCKNLSFESKPDYQFLKDLFFKLLEKKSINFDYFEYKFDFLDLE